MWGMLGSTWVCGLVVLRLVVAGPVSPGWVACVALMLGSLVWPGVLALACCGVAGRLWRLDRSRSVLIGAAIACMTLPYGLVGLVLAVPLVGLVLAPSASLRRAVSQVAVAGTAMGMCVPLLFGPGPSESPSVLLVTLGGQRADSLTDRPELDALARLGVRFEGAFAPIDDERASVAALLTGAVPWDSGADESATGLAHIVSERGLRTAAFARAPATDDPALRAAMDAFDRFDSEDTWLVGARRLPLGLFLASSAARRRADTAVDRACWWMARQRSPWFAWVHLDDVLGPLDPPPPFDERFATDDSTPVRTCSLDLPLPTTQGEVQRRHQGMIAFVDHELGRLLREALGSQQPVIVVVAGTHGVGASDEAPCDDGAVGPALWHVPLVVAGPGIAPGGTVSGPVELTDVYDWLAHGSSDVLLESIAAGRSTRSAARSVTRRPGGWVASVANAHGRTTLGAAQSWQSNANDPAVADAMRSLLEAQAMRVLMRLPPTPVVDIAVEPDSE